MNSTNFLYDLSTAKELYDCLKITEEDYKEAMVNPYSPYSINKNGKRRIIEAPNDALKSIQKKIESILQDQFQCPIYCFCCWKGKNNIQNAKVHLNNKEVLTADIAHYYQNCKIKFARKFFENDLKITGEALEILLNLTFFEGHLPTGAPTSGILTILINKKLFDAIYKKSLKLGFDMSLYFDDMSFSANRHIAKGFVPYIKKVLSSHELFLKASKIRKFGYKFAHITGIRARQGGKLEYSFKKGYEIIRMLKDKNMEEMSIKQLRSLIGKINYYQQLYPRKFAITKQKAKKQLSKLIRAK